MKKKRADSNYIYLIIAIIIIAVAGTFLKITLTPDTTNKIQEPENPWKKVENNNSPKSQDEPQKNSKEVTSNLQTNEISDSSSGGSTPTSETQTNPLECTTKTLTYSIVNLNQTESCETYDGEYCTKKTIFCSAKIKNSDEQEGQIEMELIFFPENQDREENSIYKLNQEYTLNSKESIIMEGQKTITSIGQDGIANQKINCFFNTLSELQTIC